VQKDKVPTFTYAAETLLKMIVEHRTLLELTRTVAENKRNDAWHFLSKCRDFKD